MKNDFWGSSNNRWCFEVPTSEYCLQSNWLWSTRREGHLEEIGEIKEEGDALREQRVDTLRNT
jgi:hypothetical protein